LYFYLIQSQEQGKGKCPVCRRSPITENDLLDINKSNETTSSNDKSDDMSTDDDSSLKLSTKMVALLRHLNQLRQDDKMTEKCVIFSQL
jgi:DNA repair protein RAD5